MSSPNVLVGDPGGLVKLGIKGFTLIEIIVVLAIVGVFVAFALPNFNNPTEDARASNAQNNLLAIYSAEQNYRNNDVNGNFYLCPKANPCLSAIDSTLSLNIQDDGTYSYNCFAGACSATKINSPSNIVFTLTLNAPVQLNKNNPNPNPTCTSSTGNTGWCP